MRVLLHLSVVFLCWDLNVVFLCWDLNAPFRHHTAPFNLLAAEPSILLAAGVPTLMMGHWQPWTADWPLLLPGPDGDGMIIQLVLQEQQLHAAFAGDWLQHLTPECKMLS